MVQKFLLTSYYLLKGKPFGYHHKIQTKEETKKEFQEALKEDMKKLSKNMHQVSNFVGY